MAPMNRLVLSLCLTLLVGCSEKTDAAGAGSAVVVRVTGVPDENPTELQRKNQPMVDYLSGALGATVTYVPVTDYGAAVAALAAGQVDFAWLGGFTHVQARHQAEVVPLVMREIDRDFKSVFVAHVDAGVATVADVKGKTFAFVTPTSTSGGVGPRFYLVKNKIDPEKDFKNLIYAGKHDAVYLAVKNGKVDAGAVGDLYFPRWKARGILNFDTYDVENDALKGKSEIHIVGCQKVPGTPMVTRKAYGKAFLDKLRAAFVSVPFGAVDKLRFWGPTLGFVPATDADYDDLAEMKKMAAAAKKKK